MKHSLLSLLLLTTLPFISGGHWCYYQSQDECEEHCDGPSKWHTVYANCGGEKQSPINIVTRKTESHPTLKPFTFEGYDRAQDVLVKNNGHSVQTALPPGMRIMGAGLADVYKAVQFHLHWGSDGEAGSEHTIDGERYPMELHIVHIKEKYQGVDEAINDTEGFAVLGFLFEESSEDNPNYKDLIAALGRISYCGFNTTIKDLRLDSLIPKQKDLARYYRYEGSLTTPGCNEAVVWTLFEKPIPLSTAQLAAFSQKLFVDAGKPMNRTFRPVQQTHGRTVYRSRSSCLLASTAVLSLSIMSTLGLWSIQFLDFDQVGPTVLNLVLGFCCPCSS